MYMKARSSITTLEQYKDKHYGKRGEAKREKLERGYIEFRQGAIIHDARIDKGFSFIGQTTSN